MTNTKKSYVKRNFRVAMVKGSVEAILDAYGNFRDVLNRESRFLREYEKHLEKQKRGDCDAV